LVDICLQEKDYTTHNFIQWYVSEQLEEEALARTIVDKIKMIGGDKAGLYLFDRDLENSAIAPTPANETQNNE
jgi:ferritin